MEYEIIHLPKDKWKDTIIPIEYTTNQYYDVSVNKKDNGFAIEIDKKDFLEPVTHTPIEYDYPDKLYQDHWQNAYAWGVLDNQEELIAAIETDRELWSNRIRITELWVSQKYQKQGIGHALIEMAKEQARRERRRALILETQSCNVNAIDFYQHEGFKLIGMDTCCYKNNDLERKEVRLEFGWFPEKMKLNIKDIELRMETKEDYYAVELMTQHAFWNKHHLGCDEHYLVHNLRQDKDYLPELSRIAVIDGTVVGCIMYSRASVVDNTNTHEVVTFGPLCIEPKWQGCGIGELLLRETMKLAAAHGYKGIIIFGEPDYYPRIGFKTCDNFGITTADGKNFSTFMGIELVKEGLKDIRGNFYESKVFENLPKEEVEEYNKNFPTLNKLKFPDQWD